MTDVTARLLQCFQKRRELRQHPDLIVRHDVLPPREAAGVIPAAADPCVAPAPDVRGEAVAHDDRPRPVKVRDRGKAALKELPARLVAAQLFGDEDLLKAILDPGALQAKSFPNLSIPIPMSQMATAL